MPQHQTTRVSRCALSVGCALSIFLADLLLPVGMAVSLAYIAVVLLAARSAWRALPLWLPSVVPASLSSAGSVCSPGA